VDDRDEFDTEGEAPTEPAERVRIIGAQTAAVVAGEAGRAPDATSETIEDVTMEQAKREGRPAHGVESPPGGQGGDDSDGGIVPTWPATNAEADTVPKSAPGEPTVGTPELLHWTDPPTGQVPAVLDRRGSEGGEDSSWSATGDTGPAWREHQHEWDDSGFDPSLLADDTTRVGALEEAPVEERRPWEFDDLRARVSEERSTARDPGERDAGERDAGESDVGVRGTGQRARNGPSAGKDAGDREWWDEDDSDAHRADRRAGVSGLSREAAGSEAPSSGTAAPTGVASISSSPLRIGRASAPPGASMPGPFRPRGAVGRGDGEGGEGRSMPVAIATGLGFALLAVGCFKLGSVATVILATVVVTFAAAECYAALRRSGRHPATFLGLVGTVAVMVAAYTKGVAALPLVLVLVVVTAMVWYLIGAERGSPVEGIASTVLGFAWIGLLGSFAALMLAPSQYPQRHGVAFLLGAVVAAIGADVGALAVGSWIGRHPLAPRVSPNKTWEGLVGGAVLAVALSAGVTGMVHPWTPSKAAVLGIVAAVVAPLGDLVESMVKRDLGLKDMGSILPGHGGVLDRVDGVLFVLPATYYLVRVLHLG
jgi:CDP-diglyceride synthetase